MARNIELAAKFYPGWLTVIYIDPESSYKLGLKAKTDINISLVGTNDGNVLWCPKMMQRFLVADWPSVDRFIIRDADSRIDQREADAVKAWIDSDKILHVMRDHPAHQIIPGGMWGGMWRRKNWEAPKMENLIRQFIEDNKGKDLNGYQADQDFLARYVWPWAKYSCLQHDSNPGRRKELGGVPFPSKRVFPRFVGEVWDVESDGTEIPRPGDWEQIGKEE